MTAGPAEAIIIIEGDDFPGTTVTSDSADQTTSEEHRYYKLDRFGGGAQRLRRILPMLRVSPTKRFFFPCLGKYFP